jgi:alkanesulfonate monooxygenase SsuD/methylene tetrahydromethanopterin reductase-like flavin-dependent oxidoreductase (luciferase family)
MDGIGGGDMEIGFFSNGQRYNAIAKTTYDEDLWEVILADELGAPEAWISEHGTFVSVHAPDQMPCADLFICKAAALTKQIRLGPGIRPLPYFHPLQVATDCAVCDHLTGGRYMAGFGLGLGSGGSEPRGKLPGPQRDMAHEAIELILKAWTSPEPFDWNGRFWQGRDWKIIPKPFTRPHMDVGIACSRTDSTLELAGTKGFLPLISWSQKSGQIRHMIDTYLGAPDAVTPPSRDRVRVSRFVYVADSDAEARRHLRDCDVGSAKFGRLDAFIPEGGTRDDLTMERLIDCNLFFVGDPDTVYAKIRDFHEETGGFGTLLNVCGKDWGTRAQRERSMRLLMGEVGPRLAKLRCAEPALQ